MKRHFNLKQTEFHDLCRALKSTSILNEKVSITISQFKSKDQKEMRVKTLSCIKQQLILEMAVENEN